MQSKKFYRTAIIKKQAVRADMEALLASKSEKKEDASTQCSETEYLNVGMMGISCAVMDLYQDELMDYIKTGNLEEIKKRVKDQVYNMHTRGANCNLKIKEPGETLGRYNTIYIDEKYIKKDENYEVSFHSYKGKAVFVFPCTFIVVVDGKVVGTFTIDEEPDKEEGLLFTQIPYDYDYDDERWEEENLEEDSELLEEDVLSLIGYAEAEARGMSWTRYSYKIGDHYDGLYAKKNDDDMWDFAVVANNKVVFSIGNIIFDFEEYEDLEK